MIREYFNVEDARRWADDNFVLNNHHCIKAYQEVIQKKIFDKIKEGANTALFVFNDFNSATEMRDVAGFCAKQGFKVMFYDHPDVRRNRMEVMW